MHGGRGLEVDAFDRANEKEIESGKLTSLDNEVDTTTGTVKFRARFPNRSLALFPNEFVNARLLVRTLRNVTVVPAAAVQFNGSSPFVYVVNQGNTVSVQQITTLTSNDQVAAVGGLNPGVDVATSGFDRLENGAHVLARNQSPAQQKTRGGGSNNAPTGAARLDESFAAIYSPSGGHGSADGGAVSGRRSSVFSDSRFRPSRSGLPDDSGAAAFDFISPRRG